MERWHAGLALCSVIAGVLTAAHAEQVYIQTLGNQGSLGRGVSITLSGGLSFWDGSTSKLTWIGRRSVALDGRLVRTYAAEVTARPGSGWHDSVGAAESLDAQKAGAIGSLFAGAAGGEFTRPDEAVAFQTLLWEIVYEYDGSDASLDLADGRLRFGAVDQAIFDALKSLALRGGGASNVQILTHSSQGDQFRIVPLPSAASLAGLGLLATAARRRRV